MSTSTDAPSPGPGSKSAVPASGASLPSLESSSPTPSVKLPPMPSREPSVVVSQPRSILKEISVVQASPPPEKAQSNTPGTEHHPNASTDNQAGQRPETVESLPAAPEAPRRSQQRKSAWHTKFALILSAMLAFLIAAIAFAMAFTDRLRLYRLEGQVHSSRLEVMTPDWLELAVCFGPRLPAGALHHVTKAAPPNVDGATSYRRLFGAGGFDWHYSPFELLASPAAAVVRGLGRMRVTTSEKSQLELRYTDLPLLLHYSLCRNFSGFKWSQARGDGEHWLHLSMSMEERGRLLDGVTASFVDVFVYQRGTFSEFFSVSPLVAFRTDLMRPLRLRLEAELHRHVPHAHGEAVVCAHTSDKDEDSDSCLQWCLARALMRRATCTMPWMDALVFNMTAIRVIQRELPTRRDPQLFSEDLALPWMKEFSAMKSCASAAEFNAVFKLTDLLFLFETSAPDPEALSCRVACLPSCQMMKTRLRPVGGTLAAHSGVSQLRIELPHSLPTVNRRLLLRKPTLLLEMIGLLVFLFGASVIGVYDWCFVAVYHLLSSAGLLEKASSDGGAAAHHVKDPKSSVAYEERDVAAESQLKAGDGDRGAGEGGR